MIFMILTLIFMILTAAQVVSSGLPCDVTAVDGTVRSGQLVSLSADRLVLATPEGEEIVDLEQVLRIERRQAETADPTRRDIIVRLYDGSRLATARFTSSGATARAELGGDEAVELDTHQIRAVRLRPGNPELDPQFEEIAGMQHAADVLVIRKSPQALDYLEGVITDARPEIVKFRFDDQTLDVPVGKLEGLLFYSAQPRPDADPIARVECRSGSLWNVADVVVSDGTLSLITTAGVKFSGSAATLQKIDYGAGKVVFLSDLEPAESRVTPLLASSLQSQLGRLLYDPRRDQGFGGRPLQLRFHEERITREFTKGLALHSRTELTYRLSGRFRQLKGWAGLEPGIPTQSLVQLEIRADGQPLFSQQLESGDEPLPIALNVEGCRRLQIVVDYGDGSDLADRLNLCEIRVIK